MERKFSYESSAELCNLLGVIDGDRNSASLRMYPDVPEFLDSLSVFLGDYRAVFGPNFEESTRIAWENGINPNFGLNYRGHFAKIVNANAEYVKGYHHGLHKEYIDKGEEKEFFKRVYPFEELSSKGFEFPWLYVEFEDMEGETFDTCKRAVRNFTRDGYSIIDLDVKLNPRIRTRDHYYDSEVFDARLKASNEVITISGDDLHWINDLAGIPGLPASFSQLELKLD